MSSAARRIHDRKQDRAFESTIQHVSATATVAGSADTGASEDTFMSHVTNHLKFAAVGLVVGLLASLGLVQAGPQYVQASPLYTTLAITLVFTLVGGMLAGFLALRPERYLEDLDAREHGPDGD